MSENYPKNIVIAQKIDADVIIINKGKKDNVEEWMRFLVYEESDEVFDPITKESLGNLEKPKGFFKVQHIQEKLTVIVSELKRENNVFSLALMNKDISVERDILKSIRVGDKVKIVNLE